MRPITSSALAQTLRGFFTEYLPRQRAMSPHTIHSYRDSLKLLLQFVAGKHDPTALTIEELSPKRILAFLDHLEEKRRSKACTRNVRLTAIHSFFRYLGGREPQHLQQAQQILSLPFKRTGLREIQHLELAEMQAVLNAIDRSCRDGRRDFALLNLLFNTGARVSEVVDVRAADLRLQSPSSVLLRGKGRRERVCPLWPETTRLLSRHLAELGIAPEGQEHIFRNHWGEALTRFGVRLILRKHVQQAAKQVPSLKTKRLHPHSMRHSTAVFLLRSGVDISTIAHWLGHTSINTTNKYLALDLDAKRKALEKAKPLPSKCRSTGWRDNPKLIAWLESL
jgi:site-specific recombinase XerD